MDVSIEKRSVLLAGGTGFVGEAVREAIRAAGHELRLLVRSSQDANKFQDQGFDTAFGDILDPQSLYIALDGVDTVVNLVAIIKEQGDLTFERINFHGSANLVNAARQASIDRFIQMSALGAGNLPRYPYHYSKWRAETYVKDRIPDWTIFRPSIIFGPSTENHVQFVSQLADLVRSAPVTPVAGDGSARFQPIHVDDVAAAFVAALDRSETIGKSYDLGGPEELTYRQMLDEIAQTVGVDRPAANVPIPLIRLGIKLLKPLPFLEPPVTGEQLDMLGLDNTTEQNAASQLIDRPMKPFRGGLGFLTSQGD